MYRFAVKRMSVPLSCACVSEDYFNKHLRDYYSFMSLQLPEQKVHKVFYKLNTLSYIQSLGLNKTLYYRLPQYICVSNIY